jgi:hypothetical protein
VELPRVAARASCTVLLVLLAAFAPAAPAVARTVSAGASGTAPAVLDADPSRPPPGYRLAGAQVRKIAARAPVIAAELRRHPALRPFVYTRGAGRWQVSWFSPGTRGRELAQAYVSDTTGRVTEAWTGFQVSWSMARGYPGAFGRHLNLWYVWAALCALFAAAFVPRRRGSWGLLHLDAAVLLAFSISLAFFNHARIGLSVPLAYPCLLYLLGRMLGLAAGRCRPRQPIEFLVPASWLVIGLLFLVGFRLVLNATDANVIDVGYSGVIGADRIVHGEPLYGGWPASIRQGDTYGPVNYEAYVPFRLISGWSGTWDDLPAAHGAAVVFDLLTMAGLFLLGRMARGPDTGVRLAYLWAAYPFTAFALESNSDDALVALLIVAALLVARRAAARGAAAALAGLTKFAPLALAPLLWRGLDVRPRWRGLLGFAGAFALASVAVMLPVLLDGSGEIATFWRHTIAYQANRGSPFSVWGLWGGLGFEQRLVQGAAAGLALAGFTFPRRRGLLEVAAMGAAILIAVQLGLSHWFYLYIPWFFPLVVVALELAAARPAPGGAAASLASSGTTLTTSPRRRPGAT